MTITASGWELFNRVSDLGKILGAEVELGGEDEEGDTK